MSLKNIVMQINQDLYFLSLFKSRNSILDPWFSITLAFAHLEMWFVVCNSCVSFLKFIILIPSFFILNCYLFDLPTTCGYFFFIFFIFKIKFCVGHEMN